MAASFSFSGLVRLIPTWTEPLDLVDVIDQTRLSETLALANGTGAGQANCYWRDTRTVAASGTDTINLAALPLNVLGGSATLDINTLKLVYVRNKSATVSLSYGIGAETVTILPGGVFLWFGGGSAASLPVNATDQIEVANPGGSAADYEIVLAGVKA